MRLRPKSTKKAFRDKKADTSGPTHHNNNTVLTFGDDSPNLPVPTPTAPESNQLERENNILWGHCDNIAYLFEMNWHKIGWKLECLRNQSASRSSPDAIREAFQPLQGQSNSDLIPSLLRPTSMPATHAELKRTYKSLGVAHDRRQSAQAAYDSQVAKCQEADRAVHEADPKCRKELQKEITRRIKNRIVLQEQCRAKKSLLASAQRKLHRAVAPLRKALENEIATLRTAYENSQQAVETEENILREGKERHSAATKQHWICAKEVAESRKAKLNELASELQECNSKVSQIETLYNDQAASFARNDLLRFLVEHRALHHPWQLARAVAGLPVLSCRDSFARCGASPFSHEPHENYESFEVIVQTWEKRDPNANDPQLQIQLFESEINALPKTRKWRGQEVPNIIRDKFLNNQRELLASIRECALEHTLPGAAPYVITAKFLSNITNRQQKESQTTALERVLAAWERERSN